jgi:hypothetical protein
MNRFPERFERDRRLTKRHKIRTPVRLHVWKSLEPERRLEAINLSARGIYFATDLCLEKGTTVEVQLRMPAEVTGLPASEWRCTGHVVRTELVRLPKGNTGVGVQFDFYEVSRSEQPTKAVPAKLELRSLATRTLMQGVVPTERRIAEAVPHLGPGLLPALPN